MKNLADQKHTGYYILLVIMVSVGVILASLFSFNRQIQMIILVAVGLFYVGWGILHHYLHHDVTSKIVIEYVLIGSLGITIVLFFLKGGIL